MRPRFIRKTARLLRWPTGAALTVVLLVTTATSVLAAAVDQESVWAGSQTKYGYVYASDACDLVPFSWHHYIVASLYGYPSSLYMYTLNMSAPGDNAYKDLYWGTITVYDYQGHMAQDFNPPGVYSHDYAYAFNNTGTVNQSFNFSPSHPVVVQVPFSDSTGSLPCRFYSSMELFPY